MSIDILSGEHTVGVQYSPDSGVADVRKGFGCLEVPLSSFVTCVHTSTLGVTLACWGTAPGEGNSDLGFLLSV